MKQEPQAAAIDYLVIGHIACDYSPDGCVVGGTVAYAGHTAQVLGCQTAVLTSARADYDLSIALPGIHTHCIFAEANTTFENVYTAAGRVQTLHGVATPLTAVHVPDAWQRASIVHLGPIANEIDPTIINLFSNSLVGMTPQGWLRRWDENGRVYAQNWAAAHAILPLAAAVIISEEDLLDKAMLTQYRQWSRLLVLTQGYRGCTVFLGDDAREINAPRVPEVEFTGAGDIFAAAFFIRLWQTDGNPWEAARFANKIAAESVTQRTLMQKMARIQQQLATHY